MNPDSIQAIEEQEPTGPKELPAYMELEIIPESETGIRLFKLTDKRTGVIVTFAELNPTIDVHSFAAWVAAKVSRAGKTFEELFREIYKAVLEGLSTGAKLAEIFAEYGHASVADMAFAFIYIDGVPQVVPFKIFNLISTGAGQEESTRYVKIGEFGIPAVDKLLDLSQLPEDLSQKISAQWEGLQSLTSGYYLKWFDLIREAHLEQFEKNKSIKTRTLDIARNFIPLGSETAQALLNSVRVWVEVAAQMKASPIPVCRTVGEQLDVLLQLKTYEGGETLNADFAGFTKYNYPRTQVNENLANLKYYLFNIPSFHTLLEQANRTPQAGHMSEVEEINTYSGYKAGTLVAMQYIQSIYPFLDGKSVADWLMSLHTEERKQISKIIFAGHNRHNLMGNAADIRSSQLFMIKTGVGYVRDLNRARAGGRFISMLETSDFETILHQGFNDNYQMNEVEGLMHLRDEYYADMSNYYARLRELFHLIKGCKALIPNFDESFILYMMLLGHQIDLNFTLPPNQQMYTGDLRFGAKGGDMSYMRVMEMVIEDIRTDDDLLSGMLADAEPLDPNSLKQFMERS